MKLSEQIKHCLEAEHCGSCSYHEPETTLICKGLLQKAHEWIKGYEELEEQGKLLKLPCKVGDTVYQLIPTPIRRPVAKMGYRVNERKVDSVYWIVNNLNSFQKTIFLDKSEALQKVNEMEGKE